MGHNQFHKSIWQLASNPNNGNFVLLGSLNRRNGQWTVVIYDLQGRIIFLKALKCNYNEDSKALQLEDTADGVHVIKIIANLKLVTTFKMIY